MLLDALRTDATRSTGPEPSRYSSLEIDVKEFGWQTALGAGVGSAIEWAAGAIEEEGNPYAQHSVMGLIACLSLPRLPGEVLRLVADGD